MSRDTPVVNLAHYLIVQGVEFREHIWYLSESVGYSVDSVIASADFIANGHADAFARNYRAHEDEIEAWFEEHEEKGDVRESLTNRTVHELLHD